MAGTRMTAEDAATAARVTAAATERVTTAGLVAETPPRLATEATAAVTIALEAAIVRDDAKGGWTYVLLPDSREALGTGKPVRVAGTVDSVPIEATLLPFGGGTHMLPLKQAIVRALGKADGDRVAVRIAPREASGR